MAAKDDTVAGAAALLVAGAGVGVATKSPKSTSLCPLATGLGEACTAPANDAAALGRLGGAVLRSAEAEAAEALAAPRLARGEEAGKPLKLEKSAEAVCAALGGKRPDERGEGDTEDSAGDRLIVGPDEAANAVVV